MKFFRPQRLTVAILCMQCLVVVGPARSQTPAPTPAAPPQQKKQNPFETVPESADQPKPVPAPPVRVTPGTPAPAPTVAAPPTAPSTAPQSANISDPNVIGTIEFRGSRRVPQDTLRALIFTRVGDTFNEETLRRDFTALWNTGRFDDIKLESEPSDKGMIIRFVVTERPVIRTIKYENVKSITTSEILDRFKERKVGLSVESQYDPNKVQRAAVVLKEYLAERGRQFAIVDPVVRRVPPSSLEVIFNVNEGPKVKVGTITILGNEVLARKR